MRELAIIENATIESMAADQRFLAAIPCLERFRQVKSRGDTPASRCGRCQRNVAQRTMAAAYNEAKLCIAGLDGTSKARLKQLLDASRARVTFVQAGGKGMQFTF